MSAVTTGARHASSNRSAGRPAETAVPRAWYRQFWLWFTLAPLAIVVLASFVTLWLAGAPPALVVDDFGPVALAIEMDGARDRRAAALGLRAAIRFRPATPARVTVELSGDAPAALELRLIHPTRAERDRRATLAPSDGGYDGAFALPVGRMYVELGDTARTWRLTGELALNQREIVLRAGS